MNSIESRLRDILSLHFDATYGAPYWLERRADLPFDPVKEIRSVDDLGRFGPMPLEALAARPVEDFIPRRFHRRLSEFVTTETSGATGVPKRTAYLRDEFEEAFVKPFLRAAALMAFPRDLHWLYIGPSGPHIIGKAARACATALGSIDPYTVDFDPRWARKLPADSMARRRYLDHVLEQAEAILVTQRIGVLFATPPVLEVLGTRLPHAIRAQIRGVHLGGLPSTLSFLQSLRSEWFPNAKVMGGYGNSLAGVCPEVAERPGQPPEYFAYGSRLILRVDAAPDAERGKVCFHRLDESAFLPNVIERDEAAVAVAPPAACATGFQRLGLRDPKPPKTLDAALAGGLY